MKKQYLKIFAFTLFSVLFLNACDLTREPHNSIPRENSLQSLSDAKKWNTGFMAQLRGRVGGFYSMVQDYQADYLNASADFGNRGGAWHSWLTLTSSDYDVKDIWHSYYVALKNINEFLSLVEGLELTDADEKAELDSYKGDAHLLRAFYYSELAIRYGTRYNASTAGTDLCVPLVLEYSLTDRPSRATNAEVYKQIADDIAAAKGYLKGRENKPMSTVLTEDAAYALEARVALSKKDWPTALSSAERIIASGRYPLVAPIPASFTNMWRADNSTEDIVQLFIRKTDEEPLTINFYGYSSNLQANAPDWFPTKGLLDLYEDGVDLRKEVYFEKTLVKVTDYSINDLYVISKYKGNPAYNDTDVPRYIIAPKLFRMGEIYMIAAEAAYMSGNEDAIDYLNDLRESRGLDAVTATGEALLEEIKKERTRELAFEGHRLWDLRRWNEPMKRMTPQTSQNPISEENTNPIGTAFLSPMVAFDLEVANDSYRWIWPIPYNELTTNVNIKDQQNPGY
jgi:hypothetical protein